MIDSFSPEKVRFHLCLLYLHLKKMARELSNIFDGISVTQGFLFQSAAADQSRSLQRLFGLVSLS